MAQEIVTLVIEDSFIKLMVVSGRHVTTAVTQSLSSGLVVDGVIQDKDAVSQQVRDLFEANHIMSTRVIASVSGVHSIHRMITLPRLSDDILAEAVTREAEKVMPVSLDEIYMSWQAIPSSSGTEMLVCVVGSPRDSINTLIDTLHKAGLKPQLMDLRPLAAARLADEKQAIIITVQPGDFDIVIMVDGIPEVVRSLSFSTDDLLLEDRVAEIKTEVDRTIRFYSSGHESAPLLQDTPLFFGGEMADVGKLLSEQVSYQVKPIFVPLSCPEGFDGASYIANLGLTFKESKLAPVQLKVNLNVLPEAYRPKVRPLVDTAFYAVIAAGLVLVAAMAFFTFQEVSETVALKIQLAEARDILQTRQAGKDTEQLEAELGRITAAKDNVKYILTSLDGGREKVNSDLAKATSLLPGSVKLLELNHGGVMAITGSAPDNQTIINYARSLKDTGRFSRVTWAFDTRSYGELIFTLRLE